MVDGVHHAALAVSDIPRAVSFYEDVLGFTPVGPDDPRNTIKTADYFWMDIGGGEWLNLAVRPDATPAHPGEKDDPHLAFRATETEIDAINRRVTDRGLPLHETQTSIYFRDPDGNFLELTDWSGPEQ
jgi:catechol 2,3-dioxygenase-like lactoylglutathione lyase family enzyme